MMTPRNAKNCQKPRVRNPVERLSPQEYLLMYRAGKKFSEKPQATAPGTPDYRYYSFYWLLLMCKIAYLLNVGINGLKNKHK